MAGRAGSAGRRLRTESSPVERHRVFAERIAAARSDSERVSAASQLLRAAMNDPNTPETIRTQAAEQAIKFLTALTDQVEGTSQKAKGGRP